MGDRMYAVAAILTSVACVGAFVYFLPDVKPELLPGSRLNTFVKIRDEIGGENAEIGVDELSDYSPLFLPTRWNYGRNAYSPDYKRQLGQHTQFRWKIKALFWKRTILSLQRRGYTVP